MIEDVTIAKIIVHLVLACGFAAHILVPVWYSFEDERKCRDKLKKNNN